MNRISNEFTCNVLQENVVQKCWWITSMKPIQLKHHPA